MKGNHWFKAKYEFKLHTQHAHYNSSLDNELLDTEALREGSSTIRRYFQLKSEHTVTGTFLKRIAKKDINKCCDYTFQAKINVYHIMNKCQTWRN